MDDTTLDLSEIADERYWCELVDGMDPSALPVPRVRMGEDEE